MTETRNPLPGKNTETSESRLDRRPGLVSFAAAAAFLTAVHGLFAAGIFASGDPEMAFGMIRLGIMVGFATAGLLALASLLLQRLHPAWRQGDRPRAFRSTLFFAVTATAVWMPALHLLGLLAVPAAGFVAAGLALALAYGALAWVRLPEKVLRSGLAVTPLLLVLAFLPVGPGSAPSSGPETEETENVPRLRPLGEAIPEPGVDVILISIDTLRADRLGAYGQQPTLTPAMDRLGQEGVVFERVLASSPWTVPSVASMLTGLPSARHGAGLAYSAGPAFKRSPLDEKYVTVTERFATAGYRTEAIITNSFIATLGMDQGFDRMTDVIRQVVGFHFAADFPLIRLLVELTPPSGDYRAEGVTDLALDALDREDADGEGKDGDAPLFLWVHYIDPHVPYQADPSHLDIEAWTGMVKGGSSPDVLDDGTVVGEVFTAAEQVRGGMTWLTEEDRRRLADYYDRAVTYVDAEVGRLLDALRERTKERPVVVALTSDHGEELWDHGGFEHGHDYYREVTQVPLILWGAGVPAGGRVAEGVGLVDVPSTLIELAGLQPPPAREVDEGRSLVPLFSASRQVEAPADGEATIAEMPPRFSGGNLYGLPAVMVEEGSWRFILRANGTEELYDLAEDPRELYNVALLHPERSERYRGWLQPRLDVFLNGNEGEAQELSAEAVRSLRALSYVQ